jgi:hypothetical protein
VILERATLKRFVLAIDEDRRGPWSDTDWYAEHRLQAEGFDVQLFKPDGDAEWFSEQERRNGN